MTIDVYLRDGDTFGIDDARTYSILPGWLIVFFDDETEALYPSENIDMVSIEP